MKIRSYVRGWRLVVRGEGLPLVTQSILLFQIQIQTKIRKNGDFDVFFVGTSV